MLALRKIIAWGAVALAFGLLLLFALPSYRMGEASIAGKNAEDFGLQIDGKPTRLSALKGKVIVLNFWASWCPPCIAEADALNALQTYIRGKNATIVGVSVDEDSEAYERFLKEHKINFPTWRDPSSKESKSDVGLGYGTTVYPETYIIGRDGKIARKIIGEQQWDSPEMHKYFDALLKQ